jgi:hypothetical protein
MNAPMKRLLTLWLTLLAAFWFTRAAVSALLFQRADRGPEALFEVVTLPVLQTLILGWTTRAPGPPPLAGVWREVRRRRLFAVLLLADGVAVALAGLFPFPDLWAGLQAAAAGVVAGGFALRERRDPDRAWLGVFALALLTLASTQLLGWMRPLPSLLLADQSPAVRWTAFYGCLLAAGVGLLLTVQPILARRSATAADALDAAIGLGLLGGLAALLHLFLSAFPSEPWGALADAGSLAATTSLLFAALLARSAPPAEDDGFDPVEG